MKNNKERNLLIWGSYIGSFQRIFPFYTRVSRLEHTLNMHELAIERPMLMEKKGKLRGLRMRAADELGLQTDRAVTTRRQTSGIRVLFVSFQKTVNVLCCLRLL